eukprot:PhF_6_TR25762/c1_g1_i1/m.36329
MRSLQTWGPFHLRMALEFQLQPVEHQQASDPQPQRHGTHSTAQQDRRSNPDVYMKWGKLIALNEFPKTPSFDTLTTTHLRDPCPVSSLNKSTSVGFYVRNPNLKDPMAVMCIPCPRDKAKKYCKLFTDMEWGDTDFVISTDPDVIPSIRLVQLLVAYLEHVATDNGCTTDETTYCIKASEESFLKLMCPSLEVHPLLQIVSQLMRFASYLNIPCLRRLLRSFVLRQSWKKQPNLLPL